MDTQAEDAHEDGDIDYAGASISTADTDHCDKESHSTAVLGVPNRGRDMPE
jgi:hypothetical protein